MVKITSDFSKWSFYLLLICINFNNVRPELSENVNQISRDVFTKSRSMMSNLKDYVNKQTNSLACFNEINKIKNGIEEKETWALKLVDSWGKIPSGIFSGNFYELGSFDQCFNIKKNDNERLKTKYCMGKLVIDPQTRSSKNNTPKSNQRSLYQTNHNPLIQPRITLPSGIPQINFALCVPVVCGLHMLQPKINELIQSNIKMLNMNSNTPNIKIELHEETCQFEEYETFLTPMDRAAIVVFGFVFCLMLISTSYDIIFTIISRKKSEALLAFSVFTNGKKLLSYKKSKSSDIDCLHGIRVISTMWVVLGHTMVMYTKVPIRNLAVIPTFLSHYHNMIITATTIAVDTFLCISGLLVSIGILRRLQKSGKINYPLYVFHRILRLTPLLAASILFTVSLFKFFGNGPVWPEHVNDYRERCERNWWISLLFIQNYFKSDDICFVNSWYLAVDMHLYLLAPIFVYLIYRFNWKTICAYLALILGCIACTLSVHSKYQLLSLQQPGKMEIAYFPTHLRFPAWFIGVFCGYALFMTRNLAFRIPKLLNIIGWFLSIGLMVAVVLTNYPLLQVDSTYTPFAFGLYDALSRIAWSISLSFIIFSCAHGSGGPINHFLSHPLWQPLSRMSYSIYLTHIFIVWMAMATIKAPLYFSEMNAFHAFLGNYGISVLFSTVATLAFESPILVIEKLIFGPKNKRENQDDGNEQTIVEEIQTEIKDEANAAQP